MERCSKCNAGFNHLDGAILWLCPVCGEYGGEITRFTRDEYPQRYVSARALLRYGDIFSTETLVGLSREDAIKLVQ
jgi:predicted RNA-binding Zn-ribbon protein involved in translation (DUF1610 family)